MIIDYEDKGKVFTNIVSKNQVPVRIQTNTDLIRGTMHIGKDERLKDELNKSEMFIAITDASIFTLKGKLKHRCEFLALNLAQVVWIYQENIEEFSEDIEEFSGDQNDEPADE